MQKWVDFFAPCFPDRAEAETFVAALEALDPSDRRHPAKIMMHQTQRLVSIADDIPKIRPERESLQLLFLLVCAENIAKLHDDFHAEGKSRAYVRSFFERHLGEEDKNTLKVSFSCAGTPQPLQKVVDALYGVRCDVVHEGCYWGLHFGTHGTPMLNADPDITIALPLADFRRIVIRGCINAVRTYSPAGRGAPPIVPRP